MPQNIPLDLWFQYQILVLLTLVFACAIVFFRFRKQLREDQIKKIQFVLTAVATLIVLSVFPLIVGTPVGDQEFLKKLIDATVQLLAFSGIILGILFPSLRWYISDIDKLISGLNNAGATISIQRLQEANERIIKEFEDMKKKGRAIYVRIMAGLYVTFAAFGVALFIELLHLRSLGATFIVPLPTALTLSAHLSFGIEVLLLILGIIWLITTLFRSLELAIR